MAAETITDTNTAGLCPAPQRPTKKQVERATHNHTLGPWDWQSGITLYGSQAGPISAIINNEGCTVWRDGPPEEYEAVMQANLRLIAAAPDLYAALQHIAVSAEETRVREIALDAIDKVFLKSVE